MTKEITKRGRPPLVTEEVVQELVALLKVGATIQQACDYAGISPSTYHYWCNNRADFLKKMTHAQTFINVKAKQVIGNDIVNNKDVRTALEYLKATEWRPKEGIAFEDKDVRFVVTRG
jgi:hypothetical protein